MSSSASCCSGGSTLLISTPPSLRFRSANHERLDLGGRRQSFPIPRGSVAEDSLPEGWGRLSLVCPSENLGAPPVNQCSKGKGPLKCVPRKPLLQESSSLPSLRLREPEPRGESGDSKPCDPIGDKEKESGGAFVSNMSGASGSTLRRGFKATTSKLMSATSVVKRPTPTPSTFERSAAGASERGDPGRFVEGVSFKGKLIGVLEVAEARGDRMCQEALAELKVAVRAAGEHKQRIVINVAMDGIRLTDERTGDCLYHHPVHKISFIAQDMTDTRAFGYIFGSPDAGHKFFGIKTEKASSQVVIAMRDLFQVVFEKKKKEIEKARAQLEEGRDGSDFKDTTYGGLFGANGEPVIVSASLTSGARGAIADLLDLQSELTSLQRGLSEISKRAQSSAHKQQSKDEPFDPFGDSFKSVSSVETTSTKSRITVTTAQTPAPLAPPPMSCRSRHDSHTQKLQGSFNSGKSTDFVKFPVDFKNLTQPTSTSNLGDSRSDRYAALSEIHSKSEEPVNSGYSDDMSSGHRMSVGSAASSESMMKEEFEAQWSIADRHGNITHHSGQVTNYDIFTELDPLGTGKNKPFVDKKDFFNDVRKATARRILREMGDGEESLSGSPRVLPGTIPVEVSALVASSTLYATSANQSTVSSLRQPSTSTHTTPIHGTTLPSFSDSFTPAHDSVRESSAGQSINKDHAETCPGFADFNQFTDSPKSQRSDFSGSTLDEPQTSLSVGSLTVALPPESFRDSPPPFSPPPPPPHSTSGSNSPITQRYSPVLRNRIGFIKQTTIATSSPLSPKTLPRNHKFNKQLSYEMEWESHYLQSPRYGYSIPSTSNTGDGISPRPRPRAGLTKHLSSSSATLPLRSRTRSVEQAKLAQNEESFSKSNLGNMPYEEAPEPPPRPAHVEPPPLPPKRLPSHIVLKPPPRPPPSAETHYNYINEYDTSPDDSNLAKSPPIPIPVRKPRHLEYYSNRATHKSTEELFHFPKASHSPTKEYSGTMPRAASRGSTSSKCSTPRSGLRSGSGLDSVDLANTSLDQLATTLNVPVEQLAKMTVVELAACLAQLQLHQDREETFRPQSRDGYEVPISSSSVAIVDTELSHSHKSPKNTKEWNESNNTSSSFDQDDLFANFDAQFPKSPENDFSYSLTQENKFPLGAPVSEDRYAVFRELTVTVKQKSVFDENFLTPQNSMEDEISEVSSGTFKANFEDSFHQDSVELKSSISDEVDAADDNRNKEWEAAAERIDHECVTVFRSPDISEYENFEPNFECKFEDNFSSATLSDQNFTPINSPRKLSESSPNTLKPANTSHLSPFTDDFSKLTNVSLYTNECKFGKIPCEDKFVANFNISSSDSGVKFPSFQEISSRVSLSASEKSPFEDDFSDFHLKTKVEDSGFISNPEADIDRYDNVFDSDGERKNHQSGYIHRTHKKVKTKRSSSSLSAPTTSSHDKSQSPFEDDFSQRTCKYEVLRDLDAERDTSLEGELNRLSSRDKDAVSPFEDASWQGSPRHTPYDDQKSIGSLQSIQEEARKMESPFEGSLPPSSRKTSFDHDRVSRTGSEPLRKSPYSETLTPTPPCYPLRNHGQSRVSVGSEGSLDVRQSPFEDNFNPVVESLEKEFELNANSQSSNVQNGEIATGANFADFENAFQKGKIVFDAEGGSVEVKEPLKSCNNTIEIKLNEQSDKPLGEAEEEQFPDPVAEFKVSARIPKAAEVETNIFRRSSDPFSDEFFDADLPENGPELETGPSHNASKDPFWEESFDNFKFNV